MMGCTFHPALCVSCTKRFTSAFAYCKLSASMPSKSALLQLPSCCCPLLSALLYPFVCALLAALLALFDGSWKERVAMTCRKNAAYILQPLLQHSTSRAHCTWHSHKGQLSPFRTARPNTQQPQICQLHVNIHASEDT